MVMGNTPVERLKTAPNNWVRSARVHSARMPSMCGSVLEFQEPGRQRGTHVLGLAAVYWGHGTGVMACGSLPPTRRNLRCAAAEKCSAAPPSGIALNRQISAYGAFFCGQPVQNLCLAWAQYIGSGTTENQAAFLPGIMVKVAADIAIIY